MPKNPDASAVQAMLTQKFTSKVENQFNPRVLARAAEAVGAEMVKIVQERTSQGIGTDGKRFSARSGKYIAYKGKFISRGYKRYKGRGKNKQLVGERITSLAAAKSNNWLRRTGRMLSAVFVKKATSSQVKGGFQNNIIIAFNNKEAERIAGYHIAGAGNLPKRSFLGLSAKGTAGYAKEQRRIKEVFFKTVGIK